MRGMTITQALRSARSQLSASSDAPALDAQWLMLEVLGQDEASWLISHGEDKITRKEQERYEGLVTRRKAGEPLAYILGEWEFYGRKFIVSRDALIPRPSTERLVEEAGQVIARMYEQKRRKLAVADVGTGSGCIAITLIKETEKINNVIATDISEKALKTARRNAIRYGVAEMITFLRGDMLEPLKERNVDLIVSNPPYVPSGELRKVRLSPTLDTRGLCFEPSLALDGGEDGRSYVKKIEESGIPAVVECVGDKVKLFNIEK